MNEHAAARAQESTYGVTADYVPGSPHLAHPGLHSWLLGRLSHLVANTPGPSGRCRVLEVGAGHGTFTEHLIAAGAQVTVTEMSRASADVLTHRFAGSPDVRVLHDPDGEALFGGGEEYDLALCVSVLHHVPDYAAFVTRVTQIVRPGGVLAAYQDPDWYPRRRWIDMTADRAAYFAWRIGQGDLVAGAGTRLRRLRGQLDEHRAADMTEYHVVRNGVDDAALADLLNTRFHAVETLRYWSTQARPLQWLGVRLGLRNTFAVEATGRREERP